MAFPTVRSWPVFASLGAHAALAVALVASGVPATSKASPRSDTRDIWIGETLEAVDPDGTATATPEKPKGDPDTAKAVAPAPTVVAPAPTVVRSDEARPAKVPHSPEREVSLAERILSYQPKIRRSGHDEPEEAAGESPRGTTGGMVGNKDDASARGFAKAFARALPAANSGDPVWNQLPLGTVGFVRLSVTVDEDGEIVESRVRDKPSKPPVVLSRLVDRTLLLLQGGRFALTNSKSGTESLRIEVMLSERPVESSPLALGFEAPVPGKPGRAYFQLSTGRLVEATVTIESR